MASIIFQALSPGGAPVCYAFQKGECTRGDGCRFAHGAGGAGGGARPGGGSGGPPCYSFQKAGSDEYCSSCHHTPFGPSFLTGATAKARYLLIHADAYLSLSRSD